MKRYLLTLPAALPARETKPHLKRPGKRFTLAAFSSIAVLSVAVAAKAGDDTSKDKNPVPVVSSSIWEKPAWLTELSLAVHESYDSNVYLINSGLLKDKPSFVTTISPRIGVDLAPLLGKPDLLQVATFGYAPDFVIFHDQPTQTYNAQRFTTGLKGQDGDFSYSLDNAFTYVDGNNVAPLFPGGLNAIGTATVRDRLDQFQERSKVSFRYDLGDFFIRPTASLLDYDLRTKLQDAAGPTEGYQNYVDRYDVNGGADVGYKVNPDNAFILGYRYGHQYQQSYAWDPNHTNASNDYQRLLLGFEGKPLKWLTLQVLAGPDFRSYGPDTPLPANDRDEVKPYAEATATAELTSLDTLAIKYTRWSWVSCLGRTAYVDSLYDLSYRHKITSKLSLQAGARAANANYDPNTVIGPRNDWEYTLSAGLRYDFTANVSADVSFANDWGRSDEDDLTDEATHGRAFERQVVSIGTKWQF